MSELTNRQREIVEIVRQYMEEHGCSPSFREIGERTGITTAAVNLQVLQPGAKGSD